MTKPNIIIPANHKIAVDIINCQIREYETAKSQNCSTEYEVLQGNAINIGLEVLSAITGHKYLWIRREMKNGRLYSSVCRIKETDDDYDVYSNCATALKDGNYNG